MLAEETISISPGLLLVFGSENAQCLPQSSHGRDGYPGWPARTQVRVMRLDGRRMGHPPVHCRGPISYECRRHPDVRMTGQLEGSSIEPQSQLAGAGRIVGRFARVSELGSPVCPSQLAAIQPRCPQWSSYSFSQPRAASEFILQNDKPAYHMQLGRPLGCDMNQLFN